MNFLPSGVDFGRSQRREVRNPVLRLPAAQAIVGLPIEQRRPLGALAEDGLRGIDRAIAAWPAEFREIVWIAVADIASQRAEAARGPQSKPQEGGK